MREIGRIDRILDKIGKIWHNVEDQRFYQMLINSGLIPDSQMWHIEDTDVEEHIDLILTKINKEHGNKKHKSK
jgi:hypothetical protein